ncbi:hypothetical protein P9112_005556 [Eukaryota sp. TZLM1-RC]
MAPEEQKIAQPEEEEDFDVFGEEDEEEQAKLLEQKAKEAQKRIDERNKAKGKDVIAKSLIVMDIKTWGPEIDIDELANKLKEEVQRDGLVWGSHTKVPIGFGVSKLQQTLVIEDEKIPSMDEVQEAIEELDDYVQSTDIVSFNKL